MAWKQIISYITQRAMVDGEDADQGPASQYWQRYASDYHYGGNLAGLRSTARRLTPSPPRKELEVRRHRTPKVLTCLWMQFENLNLRITSIRLSILDICNNRALLKKHHLRKLDRENISTYRHRSVFLLAFQPSGQLSILSTSVS